MSTKYNFKGRRVVVTGGGRGLGLGIVKHFIDAEASVIAIDYDAALLEKLKNDFPAVETHQVDLSDWEGTRNVIQSIDVIHHLVNNAGTGRPSEKFLDIQSNSIDQIFHLNFKSMVNVSQVVSRSMIENKIEGGTICNVSSISDVVAVGGLAVYSCSKAAVTMLTKCMALELGEYGIRVNCIRPAMVRTELVGTLSGNQSETLQNVLKANSRKIINRLAEVSEVGDAVLFLSSSASSMTTGSDVTLDGGMLTC
ncbi:Carbonyl reductase [NADPH] 2 [Orchesella cincta]|uniref:Carbonyl reductase [NADPH] 2 n=1 Tax=Orchesella cincta TaxID=48709 RepID=A0A1D2MBW8_ORCCI|nr:Carbonyl reductase [NADPH] 2 [Orchesella cincta]